MVIYFDNNGTTKCSAATKKAIVTWLKNPCNPSADNTDAISAKAMIEKFKNYVLTHIGTNSKKYTVVITSGASEANAFILTSCVKSYKRETGVIPHIVISAIEHKSILETCRNLYENGDAEYTLAEPDKYGFIHKKEVEKCIKKNTCIVSIMYANNELGSINDIKSISSICHKHNVPFHTDAVQVFGKYKLDIAKNGIDALSMSFHKLYAGMGIGLLVVSNKLIKEYKLCPHISGTQQNGLRGGTECVHAIAGAYAGMKENFKARVYKNKLLSNMSNKTLDNLAKILSITDIDNKPLRPLSKLAEINKNITIVVLGAPRNIENRYLPNTLLISINKKSQPPFCNVKLKKFLISNKIYVSIGSACNTSSSKASHVIEAIKVPTSVRQGILRVSFGDYNSMSEVDKFTAKLIEGIKKQVNITTSIIK